MLRYKIDVLAALKAAGFTQYKLQKENILSKSSVQKIRSGEVVGLANQHKICALLECQISDFIEYVPDKGKDD